MSLLISLSNETATFAALNFFATISPVAQRVAQGDAANRMQSRHGVAVSTLLLPQNMISTVAIGLWVMVITRRAPRQRGRWQQYSALGVMRSY